MRSALAIPLLLVSVPAMGQAYQCRIPNNPVTTAKPKQDGPSRRAPVTGYTLALSWSPEYCRTRSASTPDRLQCSGRNGWFGLVVHGLWPEGRGNNWPQWCRPGSHASARSMRPYLCMTPSPRLLSHEWAKHGSCMVRRPETYYRVSKILWDSLRLPDLDRLSRKKGLTAGDVRQALADANPPHFRPNQIGVDLSRRGWLREIRICYGKDFMPTACDRRRLGAADRESVKIWRGM